VLKPKYMWHKKFNSWLNKKYLYDRYKDERIVVSYDSICLLAKKTILGVCTGQSTAGYYLLAQNIPVIEYCQYAEKWKRTFRLNWKEF
ncbi:MAG: hypothetical protein ABIJ10_06140, partial [Candidatus Micrarchaeota archaeon]